MQAPVLDVHFVGQVVLEFVVLALLPHQHGPLSRIQPVGVELVAPNQLPSWSLLGLHRNGYASQEEERQHELWYARSHRTSPVSPPFVRLSQSILAPAVNRNQEWSFR